MVKTWIRGRSNVPLACRYIFELTFLLGLMVVMGCVRNNLPLHEAVKANDIQKVKAILKQDPTSINKYIWRDESPESPLSLAIGARNEEMVRILLEAGAHVESIYYHEGTTYLGLAARHGNVGIIRLLISKGAAVNPKEALSPLLCAIENNPDLNLNAIQLLLENGADVNCTFDVGRGNTSETITMTPLKSAAEYGSLPLIKLLLEHGAKINLQRDNDWNALQTAIQAHRPKEQERQIIELLIAKGADINAKGYQGKTALHIAAEGRPLYDPNKNKNYFQSIDPKIIKLLVDKGADVNARDGKGHTPLFYAIANGHTQIIELLQKTDAMNQ